MLPCTSFVSSLPRVRRPENSVGGSFARGGVSNLSTRRLRGQRSGGRGGGSEGGIRKAQGVLLVRQGTASAGGRAAKEATRPVALQKHARGGQPRAGGNRDSGRAHSPHPRRRAPESPRPGQSRVRGRYRSGGVEAVVGRDRGELAAGGSVFS